MSGRAIFALVTVLGIAVLASCSGISPRFGGEVDDPQPGYEQMLEDDYVEPDPT